MVLNVVMNNQGNNISPKQNNKPKGDEVTAFGQVMDKLIHADQAGESAGYIEEKTAVQQPADSEHSPSNGGYHAGTAKYFSGDVKTDQHLSEVINQMLQSNSYSLPDYKSAVTELTSGKGISPESLVLLYEVAEYMAKEPIEKHFTPKASEALEAIKKAALRVRMQGGYFEDSEIISKILKTLESINEKPGAAENRKTALLHAVRNDPMLRPLSINASQDVVRSSDALPVSLPFSQAHSNFLLQPIKNTYTAGALPEEFHRIMSQAKFGKINGTEKLLIRLQPEHLGTLRIELIQKEGMLTAKVMTSTGAAKEIIESKLQQLQQAFSFQNIKVDKLLIEHFPLEHDQQGNPNKEHSSKQHDQKAHQEQNEAQGDPEHQFNQILLNVEV
ncbi:hypothetical protein E2R51_04765 [Jeotgalibacillus sp. S-D1]|uniref:flagellar hook-length control protein FliK n=1 Tax=Jeotgalibacillus sp. S-D1 TaxID=2552189 RepID=UPI00105A8EA7|nr:flagellar hook-length control protein FliK [Jeotgalibacillus sp. S-D1]TDL35040.1 hypothetical protein E2R51_04765 [Jeotgalibacillus sp. S-D1]